MNIATQVPVRTAHQGVVAGRSMASKSPIRAALPSPMLYALPVNLLAASSQSMAVETDRQTTPSAGRPY